MERNNEEGKSKRFKCKKWYDFRKIMGHECHVLHSHPTSSTSKQPFFHINNCNKNKDDLQCYFCGLQMENPKLLEIHMSSCRHRNILQICKRCRSPIRLRNRDQQYCANCSIIKDGSQEYDLRFKATTQTEGLVSKFSRTVVPERNIENGDFATVNCTGARSSLIYSRKRMAPMSDLQKQKEEKLKMKVVKHQITEKQTHFINLKIANATDVSTEKQIQIGVKQSRELHQPPDKLYKSAGKNTVQQKKDFKVASSEVPFKKSKNNNSQKHNFKTSRRTDEKVRQASKKNNNLSSKSNPTRKVVTLQLLLNSIPKNDCGMLLQSSSANKIDHFYKCCRCGKEFRNIKWGSMHYSNCKSTKFLNTVVDVRDIRWVCTICDSSFLNAQKLLNHLKGCSIFTKKYKYERACEKRCEKCHFGCISSLLFQKHDCAKELENMKTCAVRLNAVKINSVVGSVVMRECEFCSEIFDEQFTEQHFNSHHPGERSSGNFKQYFVNLNPGPSSDTVVVKTEPVSPVHEFVGNSCSFEGTEHYLHINSHRSPNPVHNISMPPPPPPVLQSSVSLSNHQSPSSQTGEPSSSRHSASEGARLINQQICKCVNRNIGDDVKPCLKCLSKLDITEFTKNFKVVPFRLAKIKQETSESLGALNSNTQADGNTAASSAQIEKEVDDMDPWRNQRLDSYLFPHIHPSLTPPSSHNGTSPPSTPTTLVQSLTHVEPCSASDISMLSLNDDISLSQLDEPNSNPVDLVDYITDDCSPVMPLMQCSDNQELFTPMESREIMHVSDVDSYNTVDAWAVVSSEGNTTIDRYICSECIHFSCLDQSSIIRHLCENHEKKLQYIAMYLVKPVSDSP